METEHDGSLPFLGVELLNRAPKIETKVYIKPTNTGLKVQEAKPSIVNQQCVVYKFKCNRCDAGYVGYTRGNLHERVDGHKRKSSSIYKHYHLQHNDQIPQRFLERFHVLAKCTSKFDCLIYEMLFIRKLKPEMNVQTDSIRAKVFV